MFVCVICSFDAPSDENLKMHIRKEHDERVMSCEKCEALCKGRTKLMVHMQSHRETSCKNCGKKIPYNSRASHMKKCIGEMAFKCENCPALFKREDHLKVHVNKKRCSIQCNICDKNLKSAGRLDKHIESVHRVQMQVVKTIEGHIGLFQSTAVLRSKKICNALIVIS